MIKKREQFVFGHAKTEDFFWWMYERHKIWVKRSQGHPRPWTEDPILHEWKFCNVFRELDSGTMALRSWITEKSPLLQKVLNIVWYRLLNCKENIPAHFHEFNSIPEMIAHTNDRIYQGHQVFTSAHMTRGETGEPKQKTMYRVLEEVQSLQSVFEKKFNTLEQMFEVFVEIRNVGPFLAYEFVSDMRWYSDFWVHIIPIDIMSWCNLGPGCMRGLRRLGLDPDLSSVMHLQEIAENSENFRRLNDLPRKQPLFEMREFEHSLCEFDKYQRVRCGEGSPRLRYQGG